MDDIVTRLRQWSLVTFTRPALHNLPSELNEAADDIERLRALCNDLYHDATCSESFCRLCGEGIREWEARRG